MSTVLEELDNILQALAAAKPPGVSGSKVKRVCELAVQNVHDNSNIITHLYKHCKKVAGTHKLGVIYIVDAIARQYQDSARKEAQKANAQSDDHTFAGGLRQISEILPSLVNDFLVSASADHKDKMKKLVDIWERSSTFSPALIAELRGKLGDNEAPIAQTGGASTDAATKPPPNTSSILQALAAMAKQASSSPQPGNAPTMGNQNISGLNVPLPTSSGSVSLSQSNSMPLGSRQTPNELPKSIANDTNASSQQLAIIQLLLQQGVPINQIQQVLQNSGSSMPSIPSTNDHSSNSPPSKSRYRGRSRSKSPQSRSRSRSPGHRRRSVSPRRRLNSPPGQRRGSPVYGTIDGNSARVPPVSSNIAPNPGTTFQPRNIEKDASIGTDKIKVYSRTLFVGGVTKSISKDALFKMFANYGGVQSVIISYEKRMAFVKMFSRESALQAKEGMAAVPVQDTTIRTRWGVGFGPRECCDYASGVSLIPLSRLTDADRRWVQSAEYGGTGGRPLEGGWAMEEPDIEIGSGVSSKAMSRRVGNAAEGASNEGRVNQPFNPAFGATPFANSNGFVAPTPGMPTGNGMPMGMNPQGFNPAMFQQMFGQAPGMMFPPFGMGMPGMPGMQMMMQGVGQSNSPDPNAAAGSASPPDRDN